MEKSRRDELFAVLIAAWDRLSDLYGARHDVIKHAPGDLGALDREVEWWESRVEGAEGELRAGGWTGGEIKARLLELRPDIADDYYPEGYHSEGE